MHRISPRTCPLGLALLALAAPACSSSSSTPARCTMQAAGNFADSADLTHGCGTVAAAADAGAPGDYALTFTATTPQLASLEITIDLGPSPAVGELSSETVRGWSATAVRSDQSGCVYTAGSDSTPQGSFTLDVTSVSGATGGSAGTAHGKLDMTLTVRTPPLGLCGTGDVESLEIVF
jgi:hypothetical protein